MRRFAFIFSVLSLCTVSTANAAPPTFATEAHAQDACRGDEVVWVNLDRGRYYHKSQASYGQGSNGVYACMKAAQTQYKESHD